MFDLTGLRALVTGATGGIGGAIARALHRQGATVTLSSAGDRRFETTDATGSFAFKDVPAGDVEITASLPGFAEADRKSTRLNSSH